MRRAGSTSTRSACAGASSPERTRLAALFAQRGRAASGDSTSIADWIDEDGAVRESGAEDAFYLAQRAPRLAPNGPLLRVAELASSRA